MANDREPLGDLLPNNFLKYWARENPQQASIILAGIACFAAVAVVLTFGIDLQSNIMNIYYIIGAGASLIILSKMLNNNIIVSAFTLFIFVLLILWTVTFIVYRLALLDASNQQRIACVVNFLEDCKVVADKVAEEAAPKNEDKVNSAIASVPKADTDKNLKVFVQFAGNISRDTVRTMMRDLQSKNWAVQGTQGGGERTALAAGQSEVRYSSDNAAAADSLAKAVTAYGISGRPVKSANNPSIPANQLEIWISN